MASKIIQLGFAVFPILSLIALFGPLRKRENRIALGAFLAMAVVGLATAMFVATSVAEGQGKVFVAAATVLLAPSGAIFIALRSAAVRSDWRLIFILLPLGYFAGCGLAVQVMVKLGVVL